MRHAVVKEQQDITVCCLHFSIDFLHPFFEQLTVNPVTDFFGISDELDGKEFSWAFSKADVVP